MRPNGFPSDFRMDEFAKGQSQKWMEFLINWKGGNFTKNDIPLGYHQVHMEPTNVWKIHLKTNFGTY